VLELPRVLDLVAGRATSELGARRIRRLRPGTDPAAVRRELDAVEEMAAYLQEADHWAPPSIPDLRPVLERLGVQGTVLDGDELLGIAELLDSGRSARLDLPEDEDAFPRLALRAGGLVSEPDLLERLRASFDDTGSVADGASRKLREVRTELRDARNGLVDLLERFGRELRDRIRVPDASVTVRSGRYCIPIRREGRSEVGGIVHDESSSGQTLFVEPPPAIEPMNRIRELEAEERREVHRILRELTGEARPLAPDLRTSLELLVEIDALYARARYALSHRGVRPELGTPGERGPYRVVEGYHPLLLAGDEEAVPFGLTMASDESVLLVSGPNAGGKTVLLKSMGLLSCLAQAGVVPPVGRDTRLPFFRRFFAVIGDEQSIEASLSTFSAQVESLREILEESGPASLVLLDEVGSHTDPAEGAALASAVLLRLAGQAGLTAATSHLGALKALAGEDDRVVNASLQFDRERLRPTYTLRRDRPGRSYAFEIARRLGLPDDLVREARARMEAGERRMEDVLSELEEKEEELARLTADAEERGAELEERRREQEARERELERREAEVERAARERAEDYLLDARQEVEEAIRDLQRRVERAGGDGGGEDEGGAATVAEASSEARDRVERAVRESREAMPEPPPADEREAPDVEPGDPVRIRSLDRRGRVRELRGDDVTVEAGGVRLTVPATDVEPVDEEPDEGGGGASGAVPSPARERRPRVEPKSEVHLRGMRVDEVERELVPYLDAAIVADLPRFRIVHGKGTGALRERVRQILASDPRVARYRSGDPGEGGSGVTIVEFE
jgi:DNA mismatch repair protein MutS2